MKFILLAVALATPAADVLENDTARTVVIRGDVNESNTKNAVSRLKTFNLTKDKPIYIFIASYGGSVVYGQSIIREMELSRALGNTLRCVAVGPVQSMAFYIFDACDERYATGNADFMWHYHTLRIPEPTPLPLLRSMVDYAEMSQDSLLNRLQKNLGLSEETFLTHAASQTVWPAAVLKQLSPDYFTIIRTTRPK